MLKWILLQTFFLILQTIAGQKSNSAAGPQTFGLFEDDDIVDISLEFDLTTYIKKKPVDDFIKADLTIYLDKTDSVTGEVGLKIRGKFRHQYCTYAPIELNFRKADFGYTDIDNLSKVKLVTQCIQGNNSENWLLREYLVYKMFGSLTDTSYRVRLLRVKYIDSEKQRKTMTRFGFFIEPDHILAKRLNASELKSPVADENNIIPALIDKIAIFNFMTGNFDWSVPLQHNIKIFMSKEPGNLSFIAVPYDFDACGLVNADYAIPPANLGLSSARERLYTGICRPEEIFRSDLDFFAEKKDTIYRMVNEFSYLKKRDKNDISDFLDGFFRQLDGNKKNIINQFRNTCEK